MGTVVAALDAGVKLHEIQTGKDVLGHPLSSADLHSRKVGIAIDAAMMVTDVIPGGAIVAGGLAVAQLAYESNKGVRNTVNSAIDQAEAMGSRLWGAAESVGQHLLAPSPAG